MNSHEKEAVDLHNSGFNCAQSVLVSYSEKLGFDKNLALSLSLGFGGGMGRLQETCGAVTGAFMAIGVYQYQKFAENIERKEKTYAMVRDFNKQFLALHGTNTCRGLIKYDLNTPEGQKLAKENNVFNTICASCISSSVRILDELLK